MGPYLPLFSLEVEHAYFPEGVCRALSWVPAAASLHRLGHAGCLLRVTDRGLLVLFDAGRADVLALQAGEADDPLRLHFLARVADPAFANYTAAPVGSSQSLLVLDSRRAVHDPDTGRWRLHAGASADTADLRPLDSPEAAEALSVPERRAPPHFAVSVDVRPQDVAEAAAGRDRRFYARLEARATVWKYCFMGELAEALDDGLRVVDLDQSLQFGAATGERLPDGRSVLAVRSVAPIALQERSPQRFQLRSGGNGTDKVLIKRLPVASPRQLSRETLGGVPTLVSEIYVYR